MIFKIIIKQSWRKKNQAAKLDAKKERKNERKNGKRVKERKQKER